MADTMRLARRGGYTILPNELVTDRRLSLKTRGLMAVILSRPPEWRCSIAGFAAFLGVGKDAIRSSLRELEAAGYLTRETIRQGGRFAGTEYVIRDTSDALPEESGSPSSGFPTSVEPTTVDPTSGEPTTGGPTSENPTEINKDITSKDIYNPPIVPPRGDGAPKHKPEWFARFWAAYPRHADRKKAVRAWDRLKPDRRLCDLMAEALALQKRSAQWQKGAEYIPLPSTWINGRRWEDEPPQPAEAPRDEGWGRVEERDLPTW